MEFFDINCFLGRWTTQGYATVDADSLAEEMARLGIGRALVRHTWGWLYDPRQGNRRLLDELCGRQEWRPCLAASPVPEDMGALDEFLHSYAIAVPSGVRVPSLAEIQPQPLGCRRTPRRIGGVARPPSPRDAGDELG